MWAVSVLGEVARTGVDMGRQLDVIGRGGEAKSPIEMTLRERVVTRIVRHPAGHLRQRRGRVEHVRRAVEESRRYLASEIADHRAIDVAAAEPPIRVAKCLQNALGGRCTRNQRGDSMPIAVLRDVDQAIGLLRRPETQLLGGRVIQLAEQAPVAGEGPGAVLPAPDRPARHAAVGSLLLSRKRPQPVSDFGVGVVAQDTAFMPRC